MNTFVCLFILLPQIRSENQNKETGEVPPDGITYVALGFDLAKTIWGLLDCCDTSNILRFPFHLLASRAVQSSTQEEEELALSGFWGSLQVLRGYHEKILIPGNCPESPHPKGEEARKQEKEDAGGGC